MRAAAFFDVDGTLTRTTVLEPLIWFQRARLPAWKFAAWAAWLALQAPYYLWLDRRSRTQFNYAFFRRYRGLKTADLAAWHRQAFAMTLQARLFPEAVACLKGHLAAGRDVVLVTGGVEWVIQPLAEHLGASHLFALKLKEQDGVCTGELAMPPIADSQKAVLVKQYAEKCEIDLSQSFAYGDSFGDVPMLECVGHPVAVNPRGRLRAIARERGWQSVMWRINNGTHSAPEGPGTE